MEKLRIIEEDTGNEFVVPERTPADPGPGPMPPEPVKGRAKRGRKKADTSSTPSQDTTARRAATAEATRQSGNNKGARLGTRKVAPGKLLFSVALNCPTALAHPTLEIEALTEAEAKAEFCKLNGISDSVHAWTITRLA